MGGHQLFTTVLLRAILAVQESQSCTRHQGPARRPVRTRRSDREEQPELERHHAYPKGDHLWLLLQHGGFSLRGRVWARLTSVLRTRCRRSCKRAAIHIGRSKPTRRCTSIRRRVCSSTNRP